MLLRRQKRPAEEHDTSHGIPRKKVLSPQGQIVFLPSEVLHIICDYLDVNSLISLCRISWRFRKLVQPLIFTEFHSGLYDQPGLWRRLRMLAKTLKSRPVLAQEMIHISVRLRKLHHVETLAGLLRPILHLATNLRSLSLPIHTATAKLLDLRAFGYLGRNLKVQATYDSILSLHEIILARSQIQHNPLCTYFRSDELQLQCMVIGSCGLDHRSTIKLLQRMRSLEIVEFYQVELLDCVSSTCDSKVAEIIKALNSSKNHLKKLALHISGFRDPGGESSRNSSLDSLLHLQDLEINEHDLTPNATFPASLTRLAFFDMEEQPSFPFTKDLAKKVLPIHLNSIISYSRAPDKLRQALEETLGPYEVEIDCRELDDSLPKGSFRVPESPS